MEEIIPWHFNEQGLYDPPDFYKIRRGPSSNPTVRYTRLLNHRLNKLVIWNEIWRQYNYPFSNPRNYKDYYFKDGVKEFSGFETPIGASSLFLMKFYTYAAPA